METLPFLFMNNKKATFLESRRLKLRSVEGLRGIGQFTNEVDKHGSFYK